MCRGVVAPLVERLRALIADERRFWIALAVFCTAVSFFKGIRLPDLWSATQSQLDYSGGFIRRGMFGEFLDLLNIHHYIPFAGISYLLMVALLLVLWWYARHFRPLNIFRAIVLAVFFSSFAVGYLASMVGFLDIPLALLVVGFLCVDSLPIRAVLAPPMIVLGILVHEIFAVVFVPVILLSFLLSAVPGDQTRRKFPRILIAYVIFLLALGMLTTFRISTFPTLPREGMAAFQEHIQQKVNFPLRPDLFLVLGRGVLDNLRIMSHYFRTGRYWMDQASTAMIFLPNALLFLWVSTLCLRSLSVGKGARRLLFWGSVVASFVPLMMNFLGWDVGRWWALTELTAFLTMLTVQRAAGASFDPKETEIFKRTAVWLIALNMASGTGLMDFVRTNTFPFSDLVKSGLTMLHAHHLILPVR